MGFALRKVQRSSFKALHATELLNVVPQAVR